MTAALRGIYAIWYREALRLRRDRLRLVGHLLSPLLFLLVFGVGLGRAIGSLTPGLDFISFLFPGIVGMSVLMIAFMSGISVVWEREMGFLKEVLVAPIPRASLVIGKTLGGATVALVQGIIMLVLSPLAGIELTPGVILRLVPLMLLVAVSIGGLGVLLASRMYSMEGFQVLMNILVMPMLFLSGVFFPVQNLPAWLGVIVRINPVTYGVDAIRQVMLGDAAPQLLMFGEPVSVTQDILAVTIFGTVIVALGIWSFSHQG
ncbi:MAG: ABC transporter permease [Dehalococcoidia bacterium]|nr:ABC transporter permease [Dehalococcoidia bacterium]